LGQIAPIDKPRAKAICAKRWKHNRLVARKLLVMAEIVGFESFTPASGIIPGLNRVQEGTKNVYPKKFHGLGGNRKLAVRVVRLQQYTGLFPCTGQVGKGQ
jgi:hypothetical protein